MHIEAITDSFDGRKISAVAKIGNAYVFCDGAEFITGNPAMQKAIASISDWRDGRKPATQNRVTLAASDGMSDTNPEIARAIF